MRLLFFIYGYVITSLRTTQPYIKPVQYQPMQGLWSIRKQRHTTLLDNVQVVRWKGSKVLAIFITQGDKQQRQQ